MSKISPFLWFNGQAEEAMNFYVSVFKDSKVISVSRYGDAGPGPKGSVMGVSFELEGQRIMALNGGPAFKLTPAVSLYVSRETQQEVDYYWDALIAGGGKPSRCGWLEDRFGLSWQIIPTALSDMLGEANRKKTDRAMQAMLQMDKIDIAKLRAAFEG